MLPMWSEWGNSRFRTIYWLAFFNGLLLRFPPDLAEFDSNPGWNYRE